MAIKITIISQLAYQYIFVDSFVPKIQSSLKQLNYQGSKLLI